MIRQWWIFIMLSMFLTIVGAGIPTVAQDVCVTDYMGNLGLPSTVAELRQYINDLREVLRECDPVSDEVIEVQPSVKLDDDGFIEDDHGCLAGILIGARTAKPTLYGLAGGDSRLGMLFEMKKPNSSRFTAAEHDEFLSDQMDEINIHVWDNASWPKGRYEVRYEPFIGADAVTLAFDVEHNAEYRIAIICT